MPRYYDDRDRDRDDSRERPRERNTDRSRDKAPWSPTRDPDDGGRPAVRSWIPTTGIDYDVISEEITLFMGPKATVERGKLADVRHTIYDPRDSR